MNMGMCSIVKIGLSNSKQMTVETNYDSFCDSEDIEPIYLMVAALEKIKLQLLGIADIIDNNNKNNESFDKDF